ncbi:hypothetical protein AHP1_1631 [Aeromonas phage Ahp1_CNU-2021]|nr:hypothetical protein AHP1_1631 [Aeromonas phage Ahp1_CNU-2021]
MDTTIVNTIYVRGNLAAMLTSDPHSLYLLMAFRASDFVFEVDNIGWLHCIKDRHSMHPLSFGSFDAAMAYVKRSGDLQLNIDCVVRYDNHKSLQSALETAGKSA